MCNKMASYFTGSAAAAAAASAQAYPPNPQYSPAAVQAAPQVAGAYSPHIAQLIDNPGQITPKKTFLFDLIF